MLAGATINLTPFSFASTLTSRMSASSYFCTFLKFPCLLMALLFRNYHFHHFPLSFPLSRSHCCCPLRQVLDRLHPSPTEALTKYPSSFLVLLLALAPPTSPVPPPAPVPVHSPAPC